MKSALFALILLPWLISGCTKKNVAGVLASGAHVGGGTGSGESYDGDGTLRELVETRRNAVITGLGLLQSGVGRSQLGDEKSCVADVDTCARLTTIALDPARKRYLTELLLSSTSSLLETARSVKILIDYAGHPTADGDSDGWAQPGAGNPIRIYAGIAPTHVIAAELHEMAHVTLLEGAYHSDGDTLGPNLTAQTIFNDLGALLTAFIATQTAPEGIVDKSYASSLQNGAYLGARHANFVRALATTADGGTIVVGGQINPANDNWSWGIAKLDAKGALDTKFGNGGLFPFPSASYSEARDVTVADDGRILVSGNLCLPGRACGMALMRFADDGSVDTTFGGGAGYLITGPAGSGAFRHKVLANGKILVAGPIVTGAVYSGIGVVRVLQNGEGLDPSFGTAGLVTDANPGGAIFNTDLTVLADGSIIAGALVTETNSSALVVLSYDSAGNLNWKKRLPVGAKGDGVAQPGGWLAGDSEGNTFSAAADWVGDHFATTLFKISATGSATKVGGSGGLANDIPYALVIDSRGRPLVAMQEWMASGGCFVVQRFGRDGLTDEAFGDRSRVRLAQAGLTPVFPKIITTPDGRVLLAGTAEQALFHDIFVYRLSGHL